jgi:hypothetical protein
MSILGAMLAFVVAAFGAWAVIAVVTSEEGSPGCAFPVFGFWGICFLSLSELWVVVAAFAGMGVGALLGVIAADTPKEPDYVEFMYGGRIRVPRSELNKFRAFTGETNGGQERVQKRQ